VLKLNWGLLVHYIGATDDHLMFLNCFNRPRRRVAKRRKRRKRREWRKKMRPMRECWTGGPNILLQ